MVQHHSKPFSQWQHGFHWKPCYHWLKDLQQHCMASVRQDLESSCAARESRRRISCVQHSMTLGFLWRMSLVPTLAPTDTGIMVITSLKLTACSGDDQLKKMSEMQPNQKIHLIVLLFVHFDGLSERYITPSQRYISFDWTHWFTETVLYFPLMHGIF